MELTGKCKEDFEKWYSIEFEKRNLPYSQGFYISDDSIKFGVYVDFFDSEHIFMSDITRGFKCFYVNDRGNMTQFNTRNEARIEAIKKANEIYNR